MELLEQCRAWHKAGDFMKIVSTIEALPEKDLTPDLEFELARAYNHVGMTARPIDTDWFVKAVGLLLKLRPILGETHDWHLRAGHAMFSLDNPGPALHEFRLALATFPDEADPDLLDASREGIATLIELCQDSMYRPRRPYAMRAATAWQRFTEKRPELERLLLASFDKQAYQPARTALEEFLGDAVPGAFEFGRDKGRFEVVFPLSRPRSHLSIIEHFIKGLPEEAKENWVFHAGRRPRTDFQMGVNNHKIGAADVLCSLEPAKGDGDEPAPEGRYDMTLHCPALIVEEDGKKTYVKEAVDVLYLINDLTLGEAAAFCLLNNVRLSLEAPADAFPFSEIRERFVKLGHKADYDIDDLLGELTPYRFEPEDDPDAPMRADVVTGWTRHPEFVGGLLEGDDTPFDDLRWAGVVPGYVHWPIENPETANPAEVFKKNEAFVEALAAVAGDAFEVTGAAAGLRRCYVDLTLWDPEEAFARIRAVCAEHGIADPAFRGFRADAPDLDLSVERNTEGRTLS